MEKAGDARVGILLVSHGSREPAACEQMARLVQGLRRQYPRALVQEAYLQLCSPSVEQALGLLHAQGVYRIELLPYFLFSGRHILHDLPALLAAYGDSHPGLCLHIRPVFGEDAAVGPLLAGQLADLFEEA